MSNEPRTIDTTGPKARSLESKLSELEELLMDLRGELRFLGCDENHPLTIRLVALIDDFKSR
ncbi:hypothetical protein [Psychromonas aquimarina]|uniref:hypothetical protein n=1 Tax=Psychromonas aquimarina TaxID=444919 RepID=UPI0012F7DEFC|nr:hypothetical protein [Psychromonas aquimarina]